MICRIFKFLIPLILITAILFPAVCFSQRVQIKAGLIRNAERKPPGFYLPEMLEKLKVNYVDLTAKFREGEYAFENINLLIIESLALNDPALAKLFSGEEMKRRIEAFLNTGGIVVQFPQLASKEPNITWLPRDMAARRTDNRTDFVYIMDRNYRLFREVSTRVVERKTVVSPEYRFSPVNGFEWWRFGSVVAYADANGDIASVMEFNFDKGRIILLTIPFDGISGMNLPFEQVRGAQLLMRNLLARCDDILNGKGPALELTEAVPLKTVKVSGRVFLDSNRNGIRDISERGVPNVVVSDAWNATQTNPIGAYSLTVDSARSRFLSVTFPTGYWPLQNFYFPLNFQKGAPDEQTIDIPLITIEPSKPSSFMFIHASDFSISDEESAYHFLEDIKDINAFAGRAAFVVMTGSLVWRDNRKYELTKQYELADKTLRNIRMPLFTAIGNQDWGPDNVKFDDYHAFRGPRFFSFEYADIYFIVLDLANMPNETSEWFRKIVEFLPPEKKILVFQQSELREQRIKQFADNRVTAVFNSVHNMATESVKRSLDDSKIGITEYMTSSFSHPGLDRMPRGFRIVAVSESGIRSNFRVGGITRHLKIASPQPGASIPRGTLPIVVNSYDTARFVNRIDCTITGEQGSPVLYQSRLQKTGDWAWRGEWNIGANVPENCRIIVTAYDSFGTKWEKEGLFKISADSLKPVSIRADWSQFQRDGSHSGLADDTLIHPLNLAWVSHAGGVSHLSSPVLHDGKIFVGTQYLSDFASNGVVAIDASTGRALWRFTTDSPVKQTVAVKDGVVVAASATGRIYGINAQRGTEIWHYDRRTRPFTMLTNGVAIDRDVVFAGDDSSFMALNLKNGEFLWDHSRNAPANISVADIPALWEDFVLIPFRLGMIKLSGDAGRIGNLRRHHGEPELGAEVEQTHLKRTPTIVDDVMYAVLHEPDARFCAYDLHGNHFKWLSELRLGNSLSSPAIWEGIAVLGTDTGIIAGVDIENGKTLWQFQTNKNITSFEPGKRTDSSVTSSPAISNGIAYIGSNDGILYGIDVKTGGVVWQYNLGCPVTGSPAISGNSLFVTTFDGTLYAFTGQ